jgi:hypothetical protein
MVDNNNMAEALRLLRTMTLEQSLHLSQCAARRAAVLNTFDQPWWRKRWDRLTAWFVAKLELYRSLRREVSKLRTENARLQNRILRLLERYGQLQ